MIRVPLLVAALLVLLVPNVASAADVFETVSVPTVGGERIHVEVARPVGAGKVPIILTYSPYTTLNEGTTPNLANDGLYAAYGKKGYARAVADVLGSRNSTGCWDYGGAREQQSGVDLVNALARLPWSNGKVAMIGGSYDGTTATMVAARGRDASGLAAIVPQAAISRWYGYAFQDGVRYFLNSEVPTDEGFDTPLAFDFGLTRTPPTNPSAAAGTLPGRVSPCEAAEHTIKGYDRTPDYDAFWKERDYLKDAARFRVPVLVTHGWQDYNVKQSEGTDLFEALGSSVPFKKLFVFQGAHGTPDHDEYAALLSRFLARTLKGERNGIEDEPPVWTEGRTASGVLGLRTERAWPVPGTRKLAWGFEGGVVRDSGTGSEEVALADPAAEAGWLWRATEPVSADTRLAGSAVLDLTVKASAAHAHLAPTLVDVAPDGSAKVISRGFLNLQYRDGLAAAKPLVPGRPARVRVRFAPQDHTVLRGHRIGVVIAGSNVVWALPDTPAGTQTTVMRGALVVPAVGPAPPAAPTIPGAVDVRPGGPGSSATPRRGRRLTLKVRRRGSRLLVTGTAPRGARVVLRVTRRGARAARRSVRARSSSSFRVTFARIPARRAVRVTAKLSGTKLTATRRLPAAREARRRPRAR
jgi:X-Pro dipeptidyl-peptidase